MLLEVCIQCCSACNKICAIGSFDQHLMGKYAPPEQICTLTNSSYGVIIPYIPIIFLQSLFKPKINKFTASSGLLHNRIKSRKKLHIISHTCIWIRTTATYQSSEVRQSVVTVAYYSFSPHSIYPDASDHYMDWATLDPCLLGTF